MVQSIFDGLTVLMFDGIARFWRLTLEAGIPADPEPSRSCRARTGELYQNIVTNISMVRRKVRDPNLVVESLVLGHAAEPKRPFCLGYCRSGNRSEIKRRLAQIIDGILSAVQINQLIEDKTSPFPLPEQGGLTW